MIPSPKYELAWLSRSCSQLRPQAEVDQEPGYVGRQRDGRADFRQFLRLFEEDDGPYSAGTQSNLERRLADARADNTDPIPARLEIQVCLSR